MASLDELTLSALVSLHCFKRFFLSSRLAVFFSSSVLAHDMANADLPLCRPVPPQLHVRCVIASHKLDRGWRRRIGDDFFLPSLPLQ
jgi:hypothetical protein